MKLVEKVQALAAEKGCTSGQIALAWVKSFNGRPGMPTIIPIPGTTQEKRLLENMADIKLTDEDLQRIEDILKTSTVIGDRYPAAVDRFSSG
jgi:pyridoxine 4-dehydrogenase